METEEEIIEGIYKTEEYLRFVTFVALPEIVKEKVFGFKHHQDFAKKYELDITTLTLWKKREDFWERVKKERDVWAKGKTANVIQALYNRIIKEGSASEVKLWTQLFENFSEKQTIDEIKTFKLNEEDKELMKKALNYGRISENNGENNK